MNTVCCIIGCPYNKRINTLPAITFHVFPDPRKEPARFAKWFEACNNPAVLSKTPAKVHQNYRICRRHFDKDCFNGGCKRVLETSIPTLFLNQPDEDTPQKISLKRRSRDDADNVSLLIPIKKAAKVDLRVKNTPINNIKPNRANHYADDEDQEITLPRTPKTYSRTVYKLQKGGSQLQLINNEEEEADDQELVEYEQKHLDDDEDVDEHLDEDEEEDYELIETSNKEDYDEMYIELQPISHPISNEVVAEWRKKFNSCPKNRLAQNVCSRVDPFEVCLSRQTIETTQHVFTHKVETEGKPMTNQKSSGRCWLFAALNCIRIPFIKQFNLEEFEFSQSYLFFWDKIERCHFFLNNIVETAQRGEEVTGRLVSFLLNDPTCDGGQWDMLVNLINKYGLIPKKYFPESFCCESSIRLNAVLKSKLREYTKVLRDLVSSSAGDDVILAKINEQMGEIYTVVAICLGIPPTSFTWEYNDKSKAYKKLGSLTPVEFYQQHVKPVFDVDSKVCLMTDPRPANKYNEMYTVDCLGNVVGGRPVLYNNQPVEFLMEMVAKSIKAGEALWFGCEVSKRFAVKLGIEDLTIHDFKLVFGVDIQTTMSKADRLLYGESAMTHAMVFTAVSIDDDGKPTKFRVENSWGEDRGDKGYLYMSADWFKEFVFEVVIDKKHVPAEVLAVMDKTPIVLPAWDPMGTLAE